MTTNGREDRPRGGKNSRPSLRLVAFKAFVLGAIVALTTYGMLNHGLFGEERWIPVAGIILVLAFFTMFVRDFYADVPRTGWVLIGLMGVLVFVKGLSLVWTISPPETVEELLRSAMYLATFALALAALSSRRLVPFLMDGMGIMVLGIADFGIMQKINPVQYNPRTMDGVRIGSTLEYSNTVAVVLAMGIILGLGRMTQLGHPLFRGLYSAALLLSSAAIYFTFSRGGFLALGVGLVALFVLTKDRLQMFANLLLFAAPTLWLVTRAQDYENLFALRITAKQRLADGSALRTDLIVALVAAFLLQAVYAALVERYELVPTLRRVLGATAIVVVVLGTGTLAYATFSDQLRSGVTSAFTEGVGARNNQGVNERLTSLSSNNRSDYWSVAWEEWKEHPLLGTGAGTFHYTWMENRTDFSGVRQVHNVYLEQGTETGVFAFLALAGFALLLAYRLIRACFRASGERRILLAALTAASGVYLIHSALEWHWYVPPSTLFFFVVAGIAAKLASREDWDDAEKNGQGT